MSTASAIMKAIKSEMDRQEMGKPELADRCGLALSIVYRAFNGETKPTLETIELMLKVLNLNIKIGKR